MHFIHLTPTLTHHPGYQNQKIILNIAILLCILILTISSSKSIPLTISIWTSSSLGALFWASPRFV